MYAINHWHFHQEVFDSIPGWTQLVTRDMVDVDRQAPQRKSANIFPNHFYTPLSFGLAGSRCQFIQLQSINQVLQIQLRQQRDADTVNISYLY